MPAGEFKIKTYNKTELADKYEVNLRVFNRMLATVPGIRNFTGKRLFTPREVGFIVEHLGLPESVFTEK